MEQTGRHGANRYIIFFAQRIPYRGEVKEYELSLVLVLGLQGNMHAKLEMASGDIVKRLNGNNQGPGFMKSLQRADELQNESNADYMFLFYHAFKAW